MRKLFAAVVNVAALTFYAFVFTPLIVLGVASLLAAVLLNATVGRITYHLLSESPSTPDSEPTPEAVTVRRLRLVREHEPQT